MIHILFNLLKNALYYVEKKADKENRHIWIWSEPFEKYHYLCIKDNGTGMSPKTLKHIFNRFYSETRHSTGLGLAFCKMVMEKWNGSITCESIEGESTTFILKFPQLKEHERDELYTNFIVQGRLWKNH